MNGARWKTRVANALIITALWVPPLVMLAWQKHYATLAYGLESQWRDHFWGNTPYALFWALLTPLVWTLARRISFDGKPLWIFLGFHLIAGFAVTLAHDMMVRWVMYLLHPNPSGPLVFFSQRWFSNWLKNPWPEEYVFMVILASVMLFRESARESRLREAELKTSLLKSQMADLKMHLQPHFLFNTLQTINSYAFRKDTDMVSQLLEQLGQLLRLVLDAQGKPWVRLGEELAFLDGYLAFEKLRFRDRLEVEIAVDSEVRKAFIPHLLLQPLVENALKHGIAKKIEGGVLRIEARRDGDVLILGVGDDGPGLREPMGSGIGLAHTRTRLSLLFGDRHDFALKSGSDGGAQVWIKTPYMEEEP